MDDRLTLSEALELVGRLIGCYPNAGKVEKSYLGALADLLAKYPRNVATRCCDPARGVARETRFLPTVADVVGWCERETEPLRRDVDYERRVDRQFRERDAWRAETVGDGLKAKGRAWLDREDPDARRLSAATNAAATAAKAAAAHTLQEANQRLFLRECEAAGVDSSLGVSPTLLKMVGA